MMDKLNKLAMPDVKSGTPQEKMNAVKKALQSLEMLTEAYNQIVPVINAKIDWLAEAEKVAKDDAQDKKIDELIAVNKMLLGRINGLESKNDELSRAQNALDKAVKSIKIPKIPSIEPLRKRIKRLEDKPQYAYDDKTLRDRISALEGKPQSVYDDKEVKGRITELESRPQYDDKALKDRVKAIEDKPAIAAVERYDDSALLAKLSDIEKLIESLDKRIDYLKRTYSEKWALQQIEVDKVKLLRDEIDAKINSAKSDFTCSCDAQSALKIADYTRRTMTEKYTEQQFQIDKIQSMLSK